MEVILSDITNAFKFIQFLKALSPIVVIPILISTLFILSALSDQGAADGSL